MMTADVLARDGLGGGEIYVPPPQARDAAGGTLAGFADGTA